MSGAGEQFCQFVSSRGILNSCDVYPHRPETRILTFTGSEYPANWVERLQPGDSLYVCTWAMRDFVANVFPRLPSSCPPFVLVTGDADQVAPTDVFGSEAAVADFLNSPLILAWFAQNCVRQHPKLAPLPIGLDYHTMAAGSVPWWGTPRSPAEQEAELLALRTTASRVALPHRAYANFHFNLASRFGSDRIAAMSQVPAECVCYEPHKITRLECWQRQKMEHRFVLSPHGNGLDCHRTWEALCLGCIPIVRTSPLDVLWEGLPVWIVNSWSEVTEEGMALKAAELDTTIVPTDGTHIPEKLLLKTWIDRIRLAGVVAR